MVQAPLGRLREGCCARDAERRDEYDVATTTTTTAAGQRGAIEPGGITDVDRRAFKENKLIAMLHDNNRRKKTEMIYP